MDEEKEGWKSDQVQELMEDLEELRKENSNLQMRVEYLEGRKQEKCSEPRPKTKRSRSVDTEELTKSKVSKWSKMKGALGWEKGPGLHQEEMDLLKVPNTSSNPSSSPSASPAGSVFSGDSLSSDHRPFSDNPISSSSSEEDLPCETNYTCKLIEGDGEIYSQSEDGKDRRKSLEGDLACSLEQNMGAKKVLKRNSSKEHKTPWSKVKGIIHNTRVVGVKRRNTHEENEDKQLENFTSSVNLPEDTEGTEERRGLTAPCLTITVPSMEELNTQEQHLRKHQSKSQMEQGSELSPPNQRKSSKWFKVKNVFLPSPGHGVRATTSAPCSPIRSNSFIYEMESDEVSSNEFLDYGQRSDKYEEVFREERTAGRGGEEVTQENIHEEIQRNYLQLQNKLTEEFQRKLQEWDKMKNSGAKLVGNSGFSSGNSSVGEELPPERLLRSRGTTGATVDPLVEGRAARRHEGTEEHLSAEFRRKLDEWERMRRGHHKKWPSREQNLQRKLLEWQCIKVTPLDLARGEGTGEGQDKGDIKELAWLEKELHKIEREKQRLDRERDKFVQREARLKKLRLAISSGMRQQEVLIPTSTGMFRFQGISQKFTRRLFEWEMARGIRPEASTFALLDPGYKLSLNASNHNTSENGSLLVRSMSVGSVAELGNSSGADGITHQPSSLSLNDMDELDTACLRVDEEVPEAIIVDLEDVGESTALVANSDVITQTPVYCYAPEEVTQLIDSSGSDSEKDLKKTLNCHQAVQSSYQLLQENMCLLNKLKQERDVCLKLEHDMEHLEGQIHDVSKSFHQEIEKLDETMHNRCSQNEEVLDIRARIDELEYHKEKLHIKGETLQGEFIECKEQETELAQLIVDKMGDLQKAHYTMTLFDERRCREVWDHDSKTEALFNMIQNLTTQLLHMAEKLEFKLSERNKTLWTSRYHDRRGNSFGDDKGHPWFPSYTFPKGIEHNMAAEISDELTELPGLMMNKILELRRTLNYLCSSIGIRNETKMVEEEGECNQREDFMSLESKDFSHQLQEQECSSPASSFTFQPTGGYWAWSEEEEEEEFSSRPELITPQKRLCLEARLEDWVEGREVSVFVPTVKKIFSPTYETERDLSVVGINLEEEERGEVVAEKPDKRKKERAQSSSPVVLRRQTNFSSASKLAQDREDIKENALIYADIGFPPLSSFIPFSNPENNSPHSSTLEEDNSTPDSLRLRAEKIRRAKEEFLSRGLVPPPAQDADEEEEDSKSIVVSEENFHHLPSNLIVKSASEGMVDQASSGAPEEKPKGPRLLSGIASRLRKLKRSKDSETASDLVQMNPEDASHSCPASPGLSRNKESSSWLRKPAKLLFRPKGKYTINNK